MTVTELNVVILNSDLYKKLPKSGGQLNYRRTQKRRADTDRVRKKLGS